MPIIQSTTVGHIQGDAVIWNTVGWTGGLLSTLGDALGKLDADIFAQHVLSAKVSTGAILAEMSTNPALAARFRVDRAALLADFLTEVAIVGQITVVEAIDASVTTRGLLDAFINAGGAPVELTSLTLAASVTVKPILGAHVSTQPVLDALVGAC